MPKRWERELQRLNEVRAPANVRAQIDEGPTGGGLPSDPGRRQRVVAGGVAVLVFVAALVFALPALRGRSNTIVPQAVVPGVVFRFFVSNGSGSGEYPAATMTSAGHTVDGNGASYNWAIDGGTEIADTFGSEFDFTQWSEVSAGAPISIEGTSQKVSGWVDSCCDQSSPPPHMRPIDVEHGDVIPTEPGRYVLEFAASWPQGGRTFYFPIKVAVAAEASPSPSVTGAPTGDPAAVFTVTRDPLRVRLTWGDQVETGSIDKSWQPTGDPYGSIPIEAPGFASFPAPIVIPPDTPVRVEGVNGWTLFPQHGSGMRSPVHLGPTVLTLRGWWPDLGFDASFGLIVAEPGATVVVPDVIGLGDQESIQALTGAGLGWQLLFRDVPGEEWKATTSDPAVGTLVDPGTTVTVTVVSRVTPLPAGAEDALGCPVDERVAFGSPHTVDLPAGAGFISNVGGIRPADDVTHVGSDTTSDGLWHVVRDGGVIAVVDYQTLDGVACAGSGIAGA